MTWTTTVIINGVDYTDETIQRVNIVWGRTSVTQAPNPTTCTATLLHSSAIGTVDLRDVAPNNDVVVTVVPTGFPAAINQVRFVGTITDVDVNQNTITFNAVASGLYLLNRMPVETWNTFFYDTMFGVWYPGAVETAIYRCWLAAVAESGLDPATTAIPLVTQTFAAGDIAEDYTAGPTTVGAQINRYNSMVPAGASFERFMYGTKYGSVGSVYYVDVYNVEAQTNYTPDLVLTVDEVDYYWAASTDAGLVNTEAVVTYTPDPLPSPTGITVETGTETSRNGRYSTLSAVTVDVDTKLAFATAAAELANYLTDRGYQPGPILNLGLQLGTMSSSRMADVFQELYANSLWETPQLHPSLPTLWWVQGYTETIGVNTYTLQMRLAALGNLWLGQRWVDVTPTLQWDQVIAPDYNWNDLQEVPL